MKPLLKTISIGEFSMPLHTDIMSDGNVDRNKKRAAAYATYLREISEYLPAETRKFALSEWYYRDPDKCPMMSGSKALKYSRPSLENGKSVEILESESGCWRHHIAVTFTSHIKTCLAMV